MQGRAEDRESQRLIILTYADSFIRSCLNLAARIDRRVASWILHYRSRFSTHRYTRANVLSDLGRVALKPPPWAPSDPPSSTRERGAAVVLIHFSKEDGTMQTAIAPCGDARTFLTHFVGGGLDDDTCYSVETFRSLANGDTVAVHADGTKPKGRCKMGRTIGPPKAVAKMRPARDEVITAAKVKRRTSGVQIWGWRAMGGFCGSPAERLSAKRRSPPDVQPSRSAAGVAERTSTIRYTSDMEQAMAYRDLETSRERDRERFKERTAERRAARLCPRCGDRPPAPGRSQCETCAEKRRASERARDRNRRPLAGSAAGTPAANAGAIAGGPLSGDSAGPAARSLPALDRRVRAGRPSAHRTPFKRP